MFETWVSTDLSRLPEIRKMGTGFSADSGANKIGVHVTQDGESVELSGTVRAWIVRADGKTITVDGSKSGGDAWVVLPAEAYIAPGPIGIYIKLISGTEVATLGGVEGYVYKAM